MKLQLNTHQTGVGEILTRDELKKVLGGMTGSDDEDICKGLPSTTYCRDGSGKSLKEESGTGCPDAATIIARCKGVEGVDTSRITCTCTRPSQ